MIKNKRGIYAIKDDDMGFVDIIAFNNDQIAERKFLEVATSGNAGDMSKYPTKFSLWKLGSFDDETGELFADLQFIVKAPNKEEKEQEKEEQNVIQFPTNDNNTAS